MSQEVCVPTITRQELKEELEYLKFKYPRSFFNKKIFKISLLNNILFYTKFLNVYNIKYNKERYYCILNNIFERPECLLCNNKTNFNINNYYNITCSVSCGSKESSNKTKNTKLERYNDPNYNNYKKQEETNLCRFGNKNAFKTDNFKKKYKENSNKNWGCDHPTQNVSVIDKRENTCLSIYGETSYFKTQEFKDKFKETCNERYGCDNPMQCEEIFNRTQKSLYSRKEYIFPSGRVEYVQGYEPQILDELLNHFEEADIICGTGLPEIWYNLDGKKHRYYPDIFIKSRNMIIEVKSTHTLEANLNKNLAKRQGCLNSGYNFWFSVGAF